MLRFLRPDNAHTPSGAGSFVAELWYLADVRSWAKQASELPATVELSASFNSAPGASDRRYAFGVSLYAFRGKPEVAPALWREKRDAALAAGDQEELADTNQGSWQRVATRSVVPPDADLLLHQHLRPPQPHCAEGCPEKPAGITEGSEDHARAVFVCADGHLRERIGSHRSR